MVFESAMASTFMRLNWSGGTVPRTFVSGTTSTAGSIHPASASYGLIRSRTETVV